MRPSRDAQRHGVAKVYYKVGHRQIHEYLPLVLLIGWRTVAVRLDANIC